MVGQAMIPLRDFWVTVLVERNRSRDIRIRARSEWSAGWLLGVLQPGATVTVTVHFSLPPGVKTLDVTPSARVLAPLLNRPATNWTFAGLVWNETKSHRITL